MPFLSHLRPTDKCREVSKWITVYVLRRRSQDVFRQERRAPFLGELADPRVGVRGCADLLIRQAREDGDLLPARPRSLKDALPVHEVRLIWRAFW